MSNQNWSEKESTHAQGYYKNYSLINTMKATRERYAKKKRILKAAQQLLKASSRYLIQ